MSAGDPLSASVRFGGRRLSLTAGDEVVFGRGKACQIRLGHDPEDTQISRAAGSLSLLPDAVLVRNLSRTQPFLLAPIGGIEQVVEPGTATTSLPHPVFGIVLVGTYGERYEFVVDATQITPRRPTVGQPIVLPVPGGRTQRTLPAGSTDGFAAGQLRILTALCEPMRDGGSGPATYRQIGERLSLSPGYVRNVLKQVRETLDARGVPGMVLDDGGPTDGGADLRMALARWALRAGVLPDSLELSGELTPRQMKGRS